MIHGNLNINGAKRGAAFPTADLLLQFDGTILDVEGTKYFVDKKQGKNFLITNYDFPTDWTVGFPYKSAATISAPVGDAELIAADFNNFLYDSGGTPNQIPVVSLFQDIDYEHRFFCKHAAQVLDSNGVEIYEPRVIEWNFYSIVQSDGNLLKCQNYFSVPTEDLTAKWVSITGNDTTGDGTKLNPYLTIEKAHSDGVNCYVTTGTYIDSNYFYWRYSGNIIGIGLCTLQSDGGLYVILSGDSLSSTIEGIIIDARNSGDCIFMNGEINTKTIKRCKIINNGAELIDCRSTNGNAIVENTLLLGSSSGSYDVRSLSIMTFNSNYFSLTKQFDQATDNHKNIIKNCNIKINSTGNINAFNLKKNSDIDIIGNNIEVILCYKAFNIGDGINNTKTFNFNYNKVNAGVVGVSVIDINIGYNRVNIKENTLTDINITGEGSNVDLSKNIFVNTLRVPVFLTGNLDAQIYNNNITLTENIGYGIRLGNEVSGLTDNTITGNVYENKIISTKNLAITTHGILIGFQNTAIKIYRNYINNIALGIVIKGSNTNVSLSPIFNNIIIGSTSYGIYFKGTTNGIVYNNTLAYNKDDIFFSENIGSDPAINHIIKNNIFYLSTQYIYRFLELSSFVGHTIDYNIIYPDGDFAYNGSVILNLSEWNTDSYDVNSQNYDPLLNSEYIPQTGSPAIGLGEILDAAYDDGLDASTNWGSDTELPTVVTKQQGALWDIGAYVS